MEIKELKKKGRSLLKKNIWTFLFMAILMSFVIGRYIINNDGFSNLISSWSEESLRSFLLSFLLI